MAFPVVVINASTGSDTAASGAGPATAVTGTAASTDGTNGKTVTIGDAVSLAGVATDGSAVIWINDTTAGHRNFDQITAISGSTVTVANGFTVSLAGQTWAIGGQRATIGNASTWRLFDNNSTAGDAMGGWTVQLDDGHSETIASNAGPSSNGVLFLRRSGATAADAAGNVGPVTLRGKPGAAVRPRLVFANNFYAIRAYASYLVITGFEVQATGHTASVGVRIDNGSVISVSDMKLDDPTNTWNVGIQCTASTGQTIRDCAVGHCGSDAIQVAGGVGVRIRDCWIHDCGGGGVNVTADPTHLSVRECLITGNANGIVVATLSSTASRRMEIDANNFYGNTGANIDIQVANDGLNNASIADNILSGGTHGLKFSAAGATDALIEAEGIFVVNNNTFNNSTAAYLSATGTYTNTTCPWASGDPGLDPQFVATGSDNYAIGANLEAAGWPLASRTIGANQSGTTTYVDIGAAQRQESAGGGGGLLVPRGMNGGFGS